MLRELNLLLIRNIRKTLGAPMWLVIGLMQPVMYLLLYMPLLKNMGGSQNLSLGQIAEVFVPGMMVIMGIGGLFAGFGFIPEMREGFITRLLVTPASRVAILLSLVFNQVLTLLSQVAILLIIAFLLGLRISLLGAALSLLLVTLIGISMNSFSYVISIAAKREDSLATAVNTVYLPIMLLSGIMLPISLAPDWLKIAAHFNPFYYAVEAARALFAGDFGNLIVWEGFGIMIVVAIIAVTMAVRSLRSMAA